MVTSSSRPITTNWHQRRIAWTNCRISLVVLLLKSGRICFIFAMNRVQTFNVCCCNTYSEPRFIRTNFRQAIPSFYPVSQNVGLHVFQVFQHCSDRKCFSSLWVEERGLGVRSKTDFFQTRGVTVGSGFLEENFGWNLFFPAVCDAFYFACTFCPHLLRFAFSFVFSGRPRLPRTTRTSWASRYGHMKFNDEVLNFEKKNVYS